MKPHFIFLACLYFFSVPSAEAFDAVDAAIRNGLEAESRGELIQAQRQFYNIASAANLEGRRTTYGFIPIEAARLAGRRSLGLTILLYQQKHPSVTDMTIAEQYAIMRRLEPGNPTWPYLQAMYGLKNAHFNQVNENFYAALKSPYGPDSVKKKARRDFDKFGPELDKILSAEAKDWRDHFDPEEWARRMQAMASSPINAPTYPNGNNNEPAPMTAAQRAYSKGDYAAGDRLSGGNGTSADVGNYVKW